MFSYKSRPRPSVRLILILFIILNFGAPSRTAFSAGKPDQDQLRFFEFVLELVKRNYVRSVNMDELYEGAIEGLIQHVDPEGSHVLKDQVNEITKAVHSPKGEIGLRLGISEGVLTVISSVENSPSYVAGIRSGDRIVKIEGESTKGIRLNKAYKLLNGTPNTSVSLTVFKKGIGLEDLKISRRILEPTKVIFKVIEPGIGYIRVPDFNKNSESELKTALSKLEGKIPLSGLILDLRDNALLPCTKEIRVPNFFLQDPTIAYLDGIIRSGGQEIKSPHNEKIYTGRLALLINEGTACVGEILAGAAQDQERALVFGRKSFGRSAVREFVPLDDGSAMDLSVKRFYTAKGREIQNVGIQPDIEIDPDSEKHQGSETRQSDKTKLKRHQGIPYDAPEKDPVIKAALTWLKSDQTIAQGKLSNVSDDSRQTH